MVVNTVNEKICASEFVGHENIVEFVEGDIIVPDIKPDILSLNKVDGNVFITKKEVQDGQIKFDGAIDIYAIYVADDEKNSIKGINAILNFSEVVNIPEIKNDMLIDTNYSLSDIEYKIVNGRKISVKCAVDISISINKNISIDVIKEIEENEKIEILNQSFSFNELVVAGEENISVKENVALQNAELPIGEILDISATIEDKDFKISYNKVLVKGDLKVHMVYVADNEKNSIETFETKIPVAGFVDLQGINDNMQVDVTYNISYLYVKPVYQDLKAINMYIESEIEVEAKAYEKKEVQIITDLYNPEYELKYDTTHMNIKQQKEFGMQEVNLTQVLTIPELIGNKILNITVKSIINNKRILDDRFVIDCSANMNITYYNNSKNTIEIKKIELPFEQTIMKDKECNLENEIFNISLRQLEYELQNNGQLQLKIILNVECIGTENLIFDVINGIEQTATIIKPVASIVIYFVKPGDTLWKIAKKYGTTVDLIMKANNLKDDKIYPGDRLIIPKKINKVKLDVLN